MPKSSLLLPAPTARTQFQNHPNAPKVTAAIDDLLEAFEALGKRWSESLEDPKFMREARKDLQIDWLEKNNIHLF